MTFNVLQGKSYLEYWLATKIARWLQLLYQLLKGKVLVSVSRKCGFPNSGQQFAKAWLTG